MGRSSFAKWLGWRWVAAFGLVALGLVGGCASTPQVKVKRYDWPKNVYLGDPKRPFESLGLVKTKVEFPTLTENYEESYLCKNYFNKAARDLLSRAKDAGGDGVVDVKSVVFLADGRMETHASAECSDDGAEGQVLVQGIAVRWKPDPKKDAQSQP